MTTDYDEWLTEIASNMRGFSPSLFASATPQVLDFFYKRETWIYEQINKRLAAEILKASEYEHESEAQMTTPQRIDGWIEADYREALAANYTLRFSPEKRVGYTPVCLVDPSRLARLEALESWAKEAYLTVLEVQAYYGVDSKTGEIIDLRDKYEAITSAQADKQGKE